MKNVTSLLLCVFFLQLTLPSFADEGGRKNRKKKDMVGEVIPAAPEEKKAEPLFKPISEVTTKCHKMEGLFNIYQDTTSGKTYLEITEDQIGQEFIYLKHVMNGILDARYFKGAYRDNKIFKIGRYYDQITLREQSTSFYYAPESALAGSAGTNINEPVVYSEKIAGMTTDTSTGVTSYLIDADKLFLAETINQVKPSSSTAKSFNLGKLSNDKTTYVEIRNYPENTDVVVEYGFENTYPTVEGGPAVTTSRYVSIAVQHSFVKVPENDFKPRYEDSRIGYFIEKVTDLTSPSTTPYRDVIKRWNLVKKDPDAALSEPVEPIVYWIGNTTPLEIREIVMEAGNKWNEAFEKAGFKNAVVMKQQPDDADWDAGDIRYNVLQWTTSPTPPFGGYGPSFINPRTGQIIGADIMLEYIYITNRIKMGQVFERAGLNMEEDVMDLWEDDAMYCDAGMYAHQETMFSNFAMSGLGYSDIETNEMLKQSLMRLILHEIGHTLGLSHNFCASTSVSLEDSHNKELAAAQGLTASVMDYHATNLSVNKEDQGYFFNDKPGVYDLWAIQWGYSEFPDDASEKEGLEQILARASEPALCFGNDADDMRSAGKGIDPYINISDLTGDPVGFSIGRIELVYKTFPGLMENLVKEGSSYDDLKTGYLMLTGNHGGALNVMSRFIGGVRTNRALAGEQEGVAPLTPIALADQKRAMDALAKYAFAPDAFQYDQEILQHLTAKRRGWDHRSSGIDPRIHSRVLNMQSAVLNQLLHPNVLMRLSDTQLYGNEYSAAAMMGDLTTAIFDADLYTNVNGVRQNLQLEYVEYLGKVFTRKSNDHIARSAALAQLNQISKKMVRAKSPDASTKAHREHIAWAVNDILDQD